MANNIAALVVAIQASFVRVSREQLGLVQGVEKDTSAAQAAIGETVLFGEAPPTTTSPIVPGVNPPQPADKTQDTVPFTITNSEKSDIYITGEDWASLNRFQSNFRTSNIDQAVRAVSNAVENSVYAASYPDASIAVGTAGTTPFGSDLSDAYALERAHNDQATIQGGRRLVIDSAAKENLGNLTQLTNVNQAGSENMLLRSIINPIANYDFGWSFFTPKAVAVGTGAGYLVNGAVAAGALTITVDTGAGTILAGDIITIVGDTTQYVVASFAALVITLNTGVKVALADNAAVTVVAAATRNLAFAEDTIKLGTRWPKMPPGGDSVDMESAVVDPMTGLIYRLAEYKGYHQTSWFLELAWGSKVMKKDDLVALLG